MRLCVDYIIPAKPVTGNTTNMVTIVFKPQTRYKFLEHGGYQVDVYLTEEQWNIFLNNLQLDENDSTSIKNTDIRFELPSLICERDNIVDKYIRYRPVMYGNYPACFIYVRLYNSDQYDINNYKVFKVDNYKTDNRNEGYFRYNDSSVVNFSQVIDTVYYIRDPRFTSDPLCMEYVAGDPESTKYTDNCFKEEGKINILRSIVIYKNDNTATSTTGQLSDTPVVVNHEIFVNSLDGKPNSQIILIKALEVPTWVYEQLLPITNKYLYVVKDGESEDDDIENYPYHVEFGTLEDIQSKGITSYSTLVGFNKVIKKAEYEGDIYVKFEYYSKQVDENRWERVPFDSTIDLSKIPLN